MDRIVSNIGQCVGALYAICFLFIGIMSAIVSLIVAIIISRFIVFIIILGILMIYFGVYTTTIIN